MGCHPFLGGGSVVVDLLFIVTPIVRVCNCSMFCCTLLYVHSSFAIVLVGKRGIVALLSLSSWCLMIAVWLFLAVPLVYLQFVIVVFSDHTNYLLLLYQFIARLGFKDRICLSCATSWSLLMKFVFKAVPVPGDKISLPLYESTEKCESLLQVEWQTDLSPQQNIFSLDYGMQVDIMG